MKNSLLFLFLILSGSSFAQDSLAELLKKHNSAGIPYITVQELAMPKTDVIILDARELNEYNVSHLDQAIYVGYNSFNMESVFEKITDKNKTLVVYCSLGIRSEIIANQLKDAGYIHVLNLYGGIFEWKNNNFPIYDSYGKETENVHVFSKSWSKWLVKGQKVF